MKDKNTICVKDGRITDLEDDRNRLKKEIESLK